MRKVFGGLAMAAVLLGACRGAETGRPGAEQAVKPGQTENIYDGGNVDPSAPVSDRTGPGWKAASRKTVEASKASGMGQGCRALGAQRPILLGTRRG